jgi:Lrp/AsnC family leucine-responsive transcriptional regulator
MAHRDAGWSRSHPPHQLVTGNLDYVLKVRARDVEALKEFVLTKLKAIPCVSETTTMLILETVKSSR